MRRRSEFEDPGDVADVVTRILSELRRGDQAHQVDDALQIRSAWPREIAAQMLAAQTDRLRQLLCRHWSPGMRDHHLPCALLERCGQREGVGRIDESLLETRRERVGLDEVPRSVVIDA